MHELYRDGFAELLAPSFPAQRWYHQRIGCWSGIWAEDMAPGVEAWIGDGERVDPYTHPEGLYFVVVAARSAAALPLGATRVSLFTDSADSAMQRAEANAAEVLRLDALLKDRDAALDRQTPHIRHLETLLAEHGRVIAERDAQLSARERELSERSATIQALQDHVRALEREIHSQNAALSAQERIIAYRESLRWWIKLPLVRARRWIDRW